jgi:rhodanese-related sulfurtransferase
MSPEAVGEVFVVRHVPTVAGCAGLTPSHNQRVPTIDELLAEARSRLVRLTPQEALAAQSAGAVLVDTRSERDRAAEGALPGALVVERTVLEWRLDPASENALPEASYDAHVVVVCSDGYSSSLAAATLQQLGITRATDLIGGFRAWKSEGLPTF